MPTARNFFTKEEQKLLMDAITEAELGTQINLHLDTAVRRLASERLALAPLIDGEGPSHFRPCRPRRSCGRALWQAEPRQRRR